MAPMVRQIKIKKKIYFDFNDHTHIKWVNIKFLLKILYIYIYILWERERERFAIKYSNEIYHSIRFSIFIFAEKKGKREREKIEEDRRKD